MTENSTIYAESIEVDFAARTWKFRIAPGTRVSAGIYALIQIDEALWREDEKKLLKQRIEQLRGALKAASGKFHDLDNRTWADDCLKWAGDAEKIDG